MTALPDIFANQIESLASELAEAMAESTVAAAALEGAEEHRSKIVVRVAALAADREAVVSRRSNGRRDEGDGAALALVQADSEGLQPIIQEAAARVKDAESRCASLSARAAHLRAQIARVETEAAREALVRHADALSEKLFETVQALETACRQTGHTGRPVWGPPPPLYQKLRGLVAQLGQL